MSEICFTLKNAYFFLCVITIIWTVFKSNKKRKKCSLIVHPVNFRLLVTICAVGRIRNAIVSLIEV